jgi:hypothetical protein
MVERVTNIKFLKSPLKARPDLPSSDESAEEVEELP